jgi:hypothetical protein
MKLGGQEKELLLAAATPPVIRKEGREAPPMAASPNKGTTCHTPVTVRIREAAISTSACAPLTQDT